jgi:hypothetical protein
MIGQVVGAGGQHAGMGGGDGSLGQRLGRAGQGPAVQRSGGADEAGGSTGAHAKAVAEPGGGGASLDAVFGAGGPAGVHGGEFGEPLALQPVHQAPQLQDAFGPGGVSQPVEGLVGQSLELGHHRRKPRRRAGRMPGRMGVRVHGGNLSTPHQNTRIKPKMWITLPVTDSPDPASREASPALSWGAALCKRARSIAGNPHARRVHGTRVAGDFRDREGLGGHGCSWGGW